MEREVENVEEELPAWSLPKNAVERIALPFTLPERVTREWAWGGSTGGGVRVCLLDGGVDATHPLVGGLDYGLVVSVGPDGQAVVDEDTEGDVCGHGTACAGIIRSVAPGCSLTSVRVLGPGWTGSGDVLVAGLRFAVEQGFDVINLSLSTTKQRFAGVLRELADAAYFRAPCLSRPRTTCR